jgi:hypothetical protein
MPNLKGTGNLEFPLLAVILSFSFLLVKQEVDMGIKIYGKMKIFSHIQGRVRMAI